MHDQNCTIFSIHLMKKKELLLVAPFCEVLFLTVYRKQWLQIDGTLSNTGHHSCYISDPDLSLLSCQKYFSLTDGELQHFYPRSTNQRVGLQEILFIGIKDGRNEANWDDPRFTVHWCQAILIVSSHPVHFDMFDFWTALARMERALAFAFFSFSIE